MYESLPTELQTGEHPEFAAWKNLMQHCADDAGWSVVTVAMLAEIKGIPICQSLTRRQGESILKTADSIGLAVEPDMRRGGKNYRWDQKLVLFHVVNGGASEIDWHAYQSAVALLSLGMQVAWADDNADEQELGRIVRHLERHFSFPAPLRKRLEARVHLYVKGEVGDASVARAMNRALSVPQRQLVGEFLFEVAAADETVCGEEEKLLRKLYKQLGLPEGDLEILLAKRPQLPVVAEPAESAGVSVATDAEEETSDVIVAAPAAPQPRFDLDRLRRIRAETLEVQVLLHTALAGDNEAGSSKGQPIGGDSAVAPSSRPISLPDSNTASAKKPAQKNETGTPPAGASRFDGLAEQFHAFAEQVCQRDDWPLAELRKMAQEHGLMPAAALEAVNEWSTGRWGDWLVEEHDTHASVNRLLLGKP